LANDNAKIQLFHEPARRMEKIPFSAKDNLSVLELIDNNQEQKQQLFQGISLSLPSLNHCITHKTLFPYETTN